MTSSGQVFKEIIDKSKTRNFKEIQRLVERHYEGKDKGKGSGYKQWKRWEYFYSTRLDKNGDVPNISELEFQAIQELKAKKRQSAQGRISSPSLGRWEPFGPLSHTYGTHIGRINRVTVDPADGDIIYAGAPSGGLWRSLDDGHTWSCLTETVLSTIGVSDIAIDPHSPVNDRTIFIQTGDASGGALPSMGLMKSVDNGVTWAKCSHPQGLRVNKILYHPADAGVLFTVGEGIYKSTDGGNTWVLKNSFGYLDIEFHPINKAILYASGPNGGVRSVDSGETWQSIPSVPKLTTGYIAVTAANPQLVYFYNTSELHKSTDQGITFKLVSTKTVNTQGNYCKAFAVSQTDANTIVVGGVDAFISNDGGITWGNINTGHVDHHSFEFFNGFLYAANDGGITRVDVTTKTTFDLSAGLNITQSYAIGHDKSDASRVITGTQDNGTSLVTGTRGAAINSGDGMECFFDYADPNILYTTTQFGDLYKHESGSRGRLINPAGFRQAGAWVTPFIMDPNNNKVLYVGYNDLWRSSDAGTNWTNVTKGTAGYGYLKKIVIAPSNSNIIYLLRDNPPFYRSTDNGASWSGFSMPGHQLIIHPQNPNILWSVVTGFDEGNKIYKSIDAGTTWSNISGSIPNVPINSSVYHKGSQNGIYLGTDVGIFYKDDTLPDWVPYDAGMPFAIINDLEINYTASKIYAGTYGRGIWVSDLYGFVNPSPTVSITSPADGQTYAAPAAITIQATADDTNGTVTKVELQYQNNANPVPVKVGEDTSAPYNFTWNNIPAGRYTLTAKAFDNGNAANTSAPVTVSIHDGCNGTGVEHEMWQNIAGRDISLIPLAARADTIRKLSAFEAPSRIGDNYGARIRGYVCTQFSGSYTFWISSDDNSELWLSSDANPANKRKIASVTGYTGVRQWNKYASQQSAPITLIGGEQYYIEALHKEATGGDHLAVGWQLPDGTQERPIPGSKLLKFWVPPPVVKITAPADRQSFTAPASIILKADASSEAGIAKVEFFDETEYGNPYKIGEDFTAPYEITWNNVQAGDYLVYAMATAKDEQLSFASVDISVTSPDACAGTGAIEREVWTGITGKAISSIPLSATPSSVDNLTRFEAPYNVADNYGARIRGFVCVPSSGNYVFWICSDDNSELWLSEGDDNPANKTKIASVTGYTSRLQWTKYPTQQSAPVYLYAGKRYYIEALHKEGTGGDHLAVGWQLPDGTLERPIPGNRLLPFNTSVNDNPVVSIITPADGHVYPAPASITIEASASDPDGTITNVEFYNGSTKLGEDATAPYTYTWSNVQSGSYTLSVVATDNSNGSTRASVQVSVASYCSASGHIKREVWADVPGTSVSSIPLSSPPTSTSNLTQLEAPSNTGSNYGARIRGFVCAPTSGDYTFWISSDDNSELWLSIDNNPANKAKIASVTGYTAVRQWTKYATQRSSPISLTAGREYYIEVLHKEASGVDHVSVGWQLPDGTQELPIPGIRLSPFVEPAAIPYSPSSYAINESELITLFPNPYKYGSLAIDISELKFDDELKPVRIEITSPAGVIVYSSLVSCIHACDKLELQLAPSLPQGIYFVNVVYKSKRFSKKLMVN